MKNRTNAVYARELSRACGGSILFAFPLLMTMEMWWIGFYFDPARFLVFMIVGFGLLVGLSYYAGFEPDEPWRDVIMDAFSAYAVAVVVSAILLTIFGVLAPDMPLREIVGKIGLVSIPAAIGGLVARKQLQTRPEGQEETDRCSYAGEVFLMFAGAVFVAFNVAPTDEIGLISQYMTPWHTLALAAISLLAQHALVYSVEFRGQEIWPGERRFAFVFLNYTVAGYGVALAVSLYILWTFGRTDGMPLVEIELISQYMSPWHALALAAISLIAQHTLVYSVEFRGQEIWPGDRRFAFVFLNYTVAGYGVALAVSLYILWTFGRTDGMPLVEIANMMIVLGFPAALGAATARLVI